MPSTTKQQQAFFKLVYSVRTGETDRKVVSEKVLKVADSNMTNDSIKDFMILIENNNYYLNFQNYIIFEALRDDIPSYMSDILSKRHGSKYLDMDVPAHTDKIPNVKIEVLDENITNKTIKEIVLYFKTNLLKQFRKSKIYSILIDNEQLNILLHDSLNIKYTSNALNTIDMLKLLYSNDIRLIDVKTKEFSNNKSNLYKFIQSYNKAYGKNIEWNPNNDKEYSGLRQPVSNVETNIENIENSKLYLYISDKADDKLRMSISNFYDSCQNIYTGGESGTKHNMKLLSNVFDFNSKVAYLMFDIEYVDDKGNKHPYTTISRMMIRYNEKNEKIMFDRVYPIDMRNIMYKIVEECTGLENNGSEKDSYYIHGVKGLPKPYMDKYKLIDLDNVGNDSEKANALAEYFGVDIDDIVEESEYEFSVQSLGKKYTVYTYDEAMEYTRDHFNDNILEYIGDEQLTNIIVEPWFDFDKFKEEYDDRERYSKNENKKKYSMDEDDNLFEDEDGIYDENGDDFEDEYVEDSDGIYDKNGDELKDFNDYIGDIYGNISVVDFFKGKSFDFYFDVNKYISYCGEEECRISALSTFDGEEGLVNGYYIYKY